MEEEEIRVLHVDDDPSLAELVAEFLEREDDRFRVETANSVDEGLELLSPEIDCVVSDYDMPGRNGLDFLKMVRDQYPDLPVILFTGKGSESVASEAISAGVTGYIKKEGGTGQYAVLANGIENAVEQYRAQRELEASRTRFELFFEQSPLGVIEWSEDFEFEHLNAAAEEILGYTEEELRGSTWERMVPEEDVDDVAEVVTDVTANEGGYHNVNENVTKGGDRIVCEWHNRVITDDDGDVVAIFSLFQDVTQRERRKREFECVERRHRALFDDPFLVVARLDVDGSVREINETGLSRSEASAGGTIEELPWWPAGERESVREAVDRAAAGQATEVSVTPESIDGTVGAAGQIRPVIDESGTVHSLFVTIPVLEHDQ